MKKLSFLFIIACLFLPAFSVTAGVTGDNIAKADSAYAQERYQEALQLYLGEMKAHGTSSDLYYNVGNTYYRMKDYTHAILYYERSLSLNPANAQARENLDFVRSKAKISEDTGASFFTDVVLDAAGRLSSNTWALLAMAAFILFLLAVAVYIFVVNVRWRKVGFFGGGILLMVSLLAVASSFYVRSRWVGQREAIVVAHSSTLSIAPHAPSPKEEAFRLREGQKVLIQDSVKNSADGQVEVWYNIRTGDSRKAWINAADVEKI